MPPRPRRSSPRRHRPERGPEAVGTALPDQGRHPVQGTSSACASGRFRSFHAGFGAPRPGAIATLRDGDTIEGVYACTRKDRLIARTGTPYLVLELRDRTARCRRACSATPTCTPHASTAATSVRAGGRVARFRGELQVELDERRARGSRHCRPGGVPARRLPRPRRARRLRRRAPRARSGRPASAPCWCGCSGTTSCAPRCARHRPRAASTMRTWAACSSTPSPWRRSPSRRARCTSGSSRTSCSPPPCADDPRRTRELTLGAEVGLSDEGRLLGHVELGLRMIEEAASQTGLDDARRLALGHCVLAHHGADALPGGGSPCPRRWRCTG